MKIVQGDKIEWVRGLEHRGGTFHFRHLLDGEPGTIDNFSLSMGRNDKDFVSPRHRHNFDQFRYQLEGDLNFARDGKMTPGMVGYFPEGASYGPQTSEATAMTIVLQFGGASGSGYLSRQECKQAHERAEASLGTFEGGVYHAQSRRARQAQSRRLPGDLGARQQAAAALSQAALSAADHDGLRALRLGGVERKSRRVRKSCSASSPSGARKPACSGSHPGATLRGTGRGIYVACSGSGRVER